MDTSCQETILLFSIFSYISVYKKQINSRRVEQNPNFGVEVLIRGNSYYYLALSPKLLALSLVLALLLYNSKHRDIAIAYAL